MCCVSKFSGCVLLPSVVLVSLGLPSTTARRLVVGQLSTGMLNLFGESAYPVSLVLLWVVVGRL